MNISTDPSTHISPSGRSRRPNPGVLGLASLGLLIGSLVSMAVLSGGGTITSPFGDTDTVAGFFAENEFAVRFASMLQVASAIVLGVYAVAVHARQQQLGVKIPGPGIGLFGGTTAAVLLAVSSCITWTQSQSVVNADPELTHAFAYASFAAGGFAHVLGLGLFVAGVAFPGLVLRLLPAAFARVGLGIAALAELSILTMVLEPAQFLIPIGRFGSLIWLIAAGFLLFRTRPVHVEGA